MKLDTTTSHLNPGRWPALSYANYRARRERKPMVVYAAPPGTKSCMDTSGFVNSIHNVWFVRPEDEAAPKGSTVVETIQPPAGLPQRESAPATPPYEELSGAGAYPVGASSWGQYYADRDREKNRQ